MIDDEPDAISLSYNSREFATAATSVTISVHDLQGRRIAEYAKDPVLGTVTLLREYVWMDGWEPFAVIEGGQVYFLAWNTVGRPEVAFDETGTVVWRARYTPFGGIEAVIVDTALTSQDLRFPGQWFQIETGLHQNWHRDYDPNTGRYLQADPLGLVDGPSVYGYALQQPSQLRDVMGLFTAKADDFLPDRHSSYGGCFILASNKKDPCSGFLKKPSKRAIIIFNLCRLLLGKDPHYDDPRPPGSDPRAPERRRGDPQQEETFEPPEPDIPPNIKRDG